MILVGQVGRDPDALRERAEEILDRREFQEAPRSWLDRAWSWFADTLGDLFGRAFGSGGTGVVLLVVLLALLGWLVWVIIGSPRRAAAARASVDGPKARLEARSTAEEWERAAVDAERRGEYREAIRCRHRALMVRLDRARLIDDHDHRTAGELLSELTASAPTLEDDGHVTRAMFDRAWYGPAAVGADQAATFDRRAREMEAAAAARRK